MGYRVAFASTGEYIDQHFGSARYFQIYDMADDKTFQHFESRTTTAKCKGNCEGGFQHLLDVLIDCDAVFVSKIGEGAAAFMISHGKRVFEGAGDIEEIMTELIEYKQLEELG